MSVVLIRSLILYIVVIFGVRLMGKLQLKNSDLSTQIYIFIM